MSSPAVKVHLSYMRYCKCRLDLLVDEDVDVDSVVGSDVDELTLKKTQHMTYE